MVKKKANSLPPLTTTLLPADCADVLELDELWLFVYCKANARWLWVALCRRTRQVVAPTVAGRFGRPSRKLTGKPIPTATSLCQLDINHYQVFDSLLSFEVELDPIALVVRVDERAKDGNLPSVLSLELGFKHSDPCD